MDDDGSSVLCSVATRRVGRLEKALADRLQPVGRDSHFLDEIILDGVGTAFGQFIVVSAPPLLVRVPFHQQLGFGGG